MWSDWLHCCDCGFSLSALWCPLSVPTVLLGFLLPWMWGISSWLLQQSAAAAPYLGHGVSPLSRRSWPWTWGMSSLPLLPPQPQISRFLFPLVFILTPVWLPKGVDVSTTVEGCLPHSAEIMGFKANQRNNQNTSCLLHAHVYLISFTEHITFHLSSWHETPL